MNIHAAVPDFSSNKCSNYTLNISPNNGLNYKEIKLHCKCNGINLNDRMSKLLDSYKKGKIVNIRNINNPDIKLIRNYFQSKFKMTNIYIENITLLETVIPVYKKYKQTGKIDFDETNSNYLYYIKKPLYFQTLLANYYKLDIPYKYLNEVHTMNQFRSSKFYKNAVRKQVLLKDQIDQLNLEC